MATLNADMKEFIANNLAWIATVSKDGELDLGPKMSMFVLDDNHLAYHLSLIHISEPTRLLQKSRMPSSA